jgi:two-component system C4-dicarboxylate transport response regulator DctD
VDPTKICILVLDRNPKSAHSIGQTLKPIGYQVSVTTHRSEAVALADEKLFNVVVKSFDPETMDAIALMNRIRAITPDTQFIFISEKATIQIAVDAIRKGAYDYLSKPINPAQLIESVRKALDFQALIAEDEQIKVRLRRAPTRIFSLEAVA